jgi:hypothetical protein
MYDLLHQVVYTYMYTIANRWLVWFMVLNATFQQYFSYIMKVCFIGGGNRITWRKPLQVTDKLYRIMLY